MSGQVQTTTPQKAEAGRNDDTAREVGALLEEFHAADLKPWDVPTPEGEAADDAGETVAEQAVETDPLESIDEGLIDAARRMGGIGDDRIRSMFKADPEAATKFLETMRDGYRQLSERFGSKGQQPQSEASVASQTAPNDGVADAAKALADKLGLDEDATKALLGVFDQLQKPLKEEVGKLRAEKQSEQEVGETRQFLETAERLFASFDGGEDRYGKGTISSVKPEQQKARRDVVRKAYVLLAGAKATGTAMSAEEAIAFADRGVNFEKVQAAKRDGAAKAGQQIRGRMSVPPSSVRAGAGGEREVEVGRVKLPASSLAAIDGMLRGYRGVM